MQGSPPLVRERPTKRYQVRVSAGITPARAGKTWIFVSTIWDAWDHPRSCGKDVRASAVGCCRPGSPPLVRERRQGLEDTALRAGITPARAGKTSCCCWHASFSRDHPRSCGKDQLLFQHRRSHSGSPPLVRERL